jgi:hypothetical protein
MSLQRWATFSVRDHKARKAFVSEVLLYDKLVIPYPLEEDKAEWKRWTERGWSPAWQQSCFEILGPLAEPVPWDERRRTQFTDRWKAAKTAGRDAYWTTKELLRQEMAATGGLLVRPVIAYTSMQEMKNAIQPDTKYRKKKSAQPEPQTKVDEMAVLFQHTFVEPVSDIPFDLDLLKRAVDLAKDPDYRKARQALYDWQEDRVIKGYTAEQAKEEMKGLLEKYEAEMKRPNWKHIRRYAFFAAALAIPGAKEMGLIAAPIALGAEASVKLVELISGKSEGAIPECLAPAVALHTARKELRLREVHR